MEMQGSFADVPVVALSLESCDMRTGRDVVDAVTLLPEGSRRIVEEDEGFRALFEHLRKVGPAGAPKEPEAARLAQRKVGTFKRDFKALAGVPWSDFVRAWRLTDGRRRLLGNRFVRVKSVAFEVGYGSTSAFSNAYFERFGERPRQTQDRAGGSGRAALRLVRTGRVLGEGVKGPSRAK